MEQPSYYAVIPAEVRYDKNLKPMEKLMYGELTCLSEKTGYCFASNCYFAELYDVDSKTVSRWISNLEKNDYITVQIVRNEKKEVVERKIFLNMSCKGQKSHHPSDKKVTTPSDLKVTYNNTSINNINLISSSKSEKQPEVQEVVKEAVEIMQILLIECKRTNPNFKKTDKELNNWIADFDKCHRIDGYSWSDIKRVLLWAKNDSFWRPNIMSAKKFREKLPMLYERAGQTNINRNSSHGSYLSRTNVDIVTQEDIDNCPF